MMKMKMQRLFFDTPHVRRQVERGRLKALRKTGGYIRKAILGNIRQRPYSVHSKPGHSPFAHDQTFKGNIFFAYDPSTKSVVVGPAFLNLMGQRASPKIGIGSVGRGTIPAVLEYGGSIRTGEILRRKFKNRARKIGLRGGWVKIAARPYVGPALARSLPYVPEHFRNTIQGP